MRRHVAVLIVLSSCAIASCKPDVTPPPEADPAISLSVASMAFSGSSGGAIAPQNLLVFNSGGGTLQWSGSSDVAWLNVSPASGASTSGQGSSLSVSVNAGGLQAGTHQGNVIVQATGAGNSPQQVPVTVTITAPPASPALSLSTSSLSFTASQGSNPVPQTFQVTNSGQGLLSWSGTASQSWLSLAPAAGALGAGQSAPVAVNVLSASLPAGVHSGTVTIADPNASNSPRTVAVTLNVVNTDPKLIALSKTSTAFTAAVGGSSPAPDHIDVTNGGIGALGGLSVGSITYAGGAQGWLAASLDSPNAPAILTLTPNSAGLPEGTYTATVPIQSPQATNSPQSVSVTLEVSAVQAPVEVVGVFPRNVGLNVGESRQLDAVAGVFCATEGTQCAFTGARNVLYGANGVFVWKAVSNGVACSNAEFGDPVPGVQKDCFLGVNRSISWTSTNSGVATVSNNGFVDAIAAGQVNIEATSEGKTGSSTVTVTAPAQAPQISLSDTLIIITTEVCCAVPKPAAPSSSVTNSGGGNLDDLTVGPVAYINGSGWITATDLSSTAAPSVFTLQYDHAGMAAGLYLARIPIESGKASNSPKYLRVMLTLTNAPPRMTNLSPSNGATGVDIEQVVEISFDKDLDQSTVNATNVFLVGPSGVVPASVSYDQSNFKVIVTPNNPLDEFETGYTIRVTMGLLDVDGIAAGDLAWSFTTEKVSPLYYYRITNGALGGGKSLDTFSGSLQCFMGDTGGFTGQYWYFVERSPGRYNMRNLFQGDTHNLEAGGVPGPCFLHGGPNTGNFTGERWALIPHALGFPYWRLNAASDPNRSLDSSPVEGPSFVTDAGSAAQAWMLAREHRR